MLPTRRLPFAFMALPLALAACGPKEPEINIGGFLDAFGNLADGFSDIQINDVPDFEIEDADEPDAGDVVDDVEIVEDIEIDTTPERCDWQIVQTIASQAEDSFFGAALAVTRGELAVSAGATDPRANDRVVLYESRADGPWELEQRIVPTDDLRAFGEGLLLDGDLLVVGAGIEQYVYIYERGAAGFEQVARVDGPAVAVDFGRAVALSGDTLFIGAARDSSGGSNAGAVYVVQRVGGVWGVTPELAFSGSDNQFLGRELSVAGDTLLVGGSGRASVYQVSDLEAAPVLLTAEGDGFGDAALATEDTLYVGAWGNLSGGAVGTVVLFDAAEGGWERAGALGPANGVSPFTFGYALASDGDVFVVGASTINDDRGADQVFIYERDEDGAWVEAARIPSPQDSGPSSSFGASVAVIDGQVFVGDAYAAPEGGGTGAVYNIACR